MIANMDGGAHGRVQAIDARGLYTDATTAADAQRPNRYAPTSEWTSANANAPSNQASLSSAYEMNGTSMTGRRLSVTSDWGDRAFGLPAPSRDSSLRESAVRTFQWQIRARGLADHPACVSSKGLAELGSERVVAVGDP